MAWPRRRRRKPDPSIWRPSRAQRERRAEESAEAERVFEQINDVLKAVSRKLAGLFGFPKQTTTDQPTPESAPEATSHTPPTPTPIPVSQPGTGQPAQPAPTPTPASTGGLPTQPAPQTPQQPSQPGQPAPVPPSQSTSQEPKEERSGLLSRLSGLLTSLLRRETQTPSTPTGPTQAGPEGEGTIPPTEASQPTQTGQEERSNLLNRLSSLLNLALRREVQAPHSGTAPPQTPAGTGTTRSGGGAEGSTPAPAGQGEQGARRHDLLASLSRQLQSWMTGAKNLFGSSTPSGAPTNEPSAGGTSPGSGPPSTETSGMRSLVSSLAGVVGSLMAGLSNIGAPQTKSVSSTPEPKDKMSHLKTMPDGSVVYQPPTPKDQQAEKRSPLEGMVSLIKAPIVKITDLLESINRGVASPRRFTREGEQQGGFVGALKEVFGNLVQAGSHFQQAATSQTASGALLSGSRALNSAAGAAGAVEGAGGLVAPLLEFGGAILGVVGGLALMLDGLKSMGEHLERTNFQFAEFSPAMARVMVTQQIREMQLSQQRGEALAPSAQKAMDTKFELDRQLFAPLSDALTAGMNNAFTALGNATLNILEFLKQEFPKFAEALKNYDTARASSATNMAATVGEEYMRGFGRPDRFPKDRPPLPRGGGGTILERINP